MAEATSGGATLQVRLSPLIPDLRTRSEEYRVDTDEVDDELRQLFRAQLEQIVAELPAATSAGRWDAVRRYAHTLQGTGGTMGLPELSVAGVALSAAAKAADGERCRVLSTVLADWVRAGELI